MKTGKKIIVVIPFAKEEIISLTKYMKTKKAFLKRHKEYFFIFVNDKGWDNDHIRDNIYHEIFGKSSPDSTLLKNMKSHSIKAGAVYTGMAYALEIFPEAELIGYIDIDDSINIEELQQIPDYAETDIIIGVRNQRALPDKIASLAFSFVVKLLYPSLLNVSDLQNGFKFFKRDFLLDYFKNHSIRDISFGFDGDILHFAIKNRYKIKEFKVKWQENVHSARNFKNISKTITFLFKKRFIKKSRIYRFINGKYRFDEDRNGLQDLSVLQGVLYEF